MPIAHHLKLGPRRRLAVGLMIGVAGALAGALLMLALAGCGGGPGSPATASQTQSAQQLAQAVWLQFARCARSHGAPDFPDPQLDSQGRASFADGALAKQEMGTSQVRQACGRILSRLPASAQQQPPVTAARLRQLVAYARCIRQHGVPDFPDPRPDGTFPQPLPQKGTPQLNNAVQACRHYAPNGQTP
jgi:hypothetical protein